MVQPTPTENAATKSGATDMTPEKSDAIMHWSVYGRRGEEQRSRATTPTSDIEPFENPVTSPWDQVVPYRQISKLLLGFTPSAMEDKWCVYTTRPDAAGNTVVHMYRSWTGQKVFEATLKLEIDEDGDVAEKDAMFTQIIWEPLADWTEQHAKEEFKGVCAWCMRVRLP